MGDSDVRAQFLLAIKNRPDDPTVRKIYADWLDDHDEPEEADFFRRWTPELRAGAVAYLEEFAKRLCPESTYAEYRSPGELPDEDDLRPRLDYEELLAVGDSIVAGGGGGYLNFDTPDFVFEERGRFWENWQIVMDTRLKGLPKGSLFHCSC